MRSRPNGISGVSKLDVTLQLGVRFQWMPPWQETCWGSYLQESQKLPALKGFNAAVISILKVVVPAVAVLCSLAINQPLRPFPYPSVKRMFFSEATGASSAD